MKSCLAHLMRRHSISRSARGFTLIELMIVVAIIAIIAAFAVPAYKEQVARSRRADGKAVLLEAAQWMERLYTVTRRYDQDGSGTDVSIDALRNAVNAQRSSAYYTLSFAAGQPTATSFVLTLTPTTKMANDVCGTFTVNNAGDQNVTGGSLDRNECWGRR